MRLQSVLRVNAASCIGFGLVFGLLPDKTAAFLAVERIAPAWLIAVLGVALIINGLGLLLTSRQQAPQTMLVQFFSLGDLLWVVGTIVLIITGWWVNSSTGIAVALLVAAGVGTLGWLQWQHANMS